MKVLGLDIGFARIGFAIGDTCFGLAFPKETVLYAKYIPKIQEYILSQKIEKIIVGIPSALEGQDSTHQQKIYNEVQRIQMSTEVECDIFEERYSSAIAQASLQVQGVKRSEQKRHKDAMAAALILQGWLDYTKSIS